MPRLILVLISIACAVASSACSDGGSGRAFADMVWQVRCPNPPVPGVGCPSDSMQRDINHLDGEEGHQIACGVSDLPDGRQSFFFRAFHGTDYGIGVQRAIVPAGGGVVSGMSCEMTIIEDDNTYKGTCGANPPSETQPCQLTGLTFSRESDGDTVTGTIFCKNVPNEVAPERSRDVTMAGPGGGGAGFSLRLVNCDGL